jgi:protein-disulfide isomerase
MVMKFSRRTFLSGSAVVVGAAALAGYLGWPRPETPSSSGPIGAAQAQAKVDKAKLLAAPPLGDRALGSADAKVVVVEYASTTCPHCANFHNTIFPGVKKDYIDSGKVKFIFREFPLNDVDLAAVMVARCAPDYIYLHLMYLFLYHVDIWY